MCNNKIIQYVVMRKDILPSKKVNGFSTGAYIAQACHAASAAMHRFACLENTIRFLDDLENMTVCVLGVENNSELESLASKLESEGVPFHLWVEKPELITTALATAPVEKQKVSQHLGHLKLLR